MIDIYVPKLRAEFGEGIHLMHFWNCRGNNERQKMDGEQFDGLGGISFINRGIINFSIRQEYSDKGRKTVASLAPSFLGAIF